jgi:thiol-disulfide isomerase/thioredoxin
MRASAKALLLIMVMITLVGCGFGGGESDGNEVTRRPAQDFTVVDAEGNEVRLSDFTGQPVVINFWTSWCPSCRNAMPAFEMVYDSVGNEVKFMMVNLTDGRRETIATASRYIEDGGYSFPVYFDVNNDAGNAYAVRSIPTTVFIDSEGNIVGRSVMGAMTERALRERISEIL